MGCIPSILTAILKKMKHTVPLIERIQQFLEGVQNILLFLSIRSVIVVIENFGALMLLPWGKTNEPRHRKPTFWFPTWPDTNQAVQLQKMARGLKFQI